MTSRINYKEIYDSLERLCKNLAGPKHREILKHVSQYVSSSPTALGAHLPYDETSLVSKISNHISHNRTQNDVTLFTKLHEQLKACSGPRQRNFLLTFLFFMAQSQDNLPSNGFENATGKLSRPVRLDPSSNILQSDSIPSVCNNEIAKASSQCFTYQEKRASISSCSENQMKIAPVRKSYIHPQSDSSDSSPRDSKLVEISNDLSEELIQNVLYVFTGIQGKYLKRDVILGSFKLEAKARILGVVQAGMLLRLSELGYYHNLVHIYTDPKSGRCAMGLMGQGFISALRNELTRYYGMVAMLQEQLNMQRRRDLQEWNSASGEKVTLMKILVWAVEPLHRLKWLSLIADACQEKKGGALASTLYEFLSNGDPMVKALVKELLIAVCGPLQQMITRWVLEGEILDPYGEFFIECLSEIGPDRLWHDKYRVRMSMLPTFISTELANKILVTGKSINFLREICQDKTPIKGREELTQCFETNAESIFSTVTDGKLHTVIDNIYLSTSKKVLDIAIGPHKLLDHLQAMRRYLLLGQGDFIGILMENLKPELDKPGKDLYCNDLSSILNAAVRSTNAQYEDPEILNHLDVRLLNAFDGDTGWDILSLKYTVRGPLATMLESSMHNYQILFKPLWRMKHIEFLLSSKIWRDQMCNAKPLRSMKPILNPVMYRLNLYTSEMIHFIHQMQYYILFEVIECSWASFQEKVQQAKALDDILRAHDEFLETIKAGAFLDAKSDALSVPMGEVYSGITKLEIWQDKFFELCFKELNARKEFQEEIKKSEHKGEYGLSVERRLQRDEEQKIFESYLASCQKNLEKIGNDYEMAVRQVLFILNSNNDLSLQLFGTRLDFNEYYKKRDQRLGVPLTFEHMRMSNVFNNKNSSMNCSRYSIN